MIFMRLILILCTLGLLFTLLYDQTEIPMDKELILISNMKNEKLLPRNFRLAENLSIYEDLTENSFPSLKGLSQLKASASGQFSEQSLAKILEIIPAKKILIVDLREEAHGFVNGTAVSWYTEKNWSNKDKTSEEIIKIEKKLLENLANKKIVTLLQKNLEPSDPSEISVQEVCSEEELTQKMGAAYKRIPVTDHLRPSDKSVGMFLELVKENVNASYWLHFHCSAGRGRSTTFMAMYDMIKNARQLSFEDILARQAFIGGKNLAEPFAPSDWRYEYHFERLDFLTHFYKYCKENPNLEQSWSSWIKNHQNL